jgi:hypothetical protein
VGSDYCHKCSALQCSVGLYCSAVQCRAVQYSTVPYSNDVFNFQIVEIIS